MIRYNTLRRAVLVSEISGGGFYRMLMIFSWFSIIIPDDGSSPNFHNDVFLVATLYVLTV